LQKKEYIKHQTTTTAAAAAAVATTTTTTRFHTVTLGLTQVQTIQNTVNTCTHITKQVHIQPNTSTHITKAWFESRRCFIAIAVQLCVRFHH
jgi:hypothetical protein